MRSFFDLVHYEYKKIFKRKSIYFAFGLAVFFSTFCMVGSLLLGNPYSYNGFDGSEMAALDQQRTAMHHAAGYLDDELMGKIITAQAYADSHVNENGNYEDGVYEQYIMPYIGLRGNLYMLTSPIGALDYTILGSLDPENPPDFAQLRSARLREILVNSELKQKEIDFLMERDAALDTPFYFDFKDGWWYFSIGITTSGVFLIFAVSICIAPVFSDEYQKKTDVLLLSSKLGKNKLVWAKLFTALTFSLGFMALFLLVALGSTLGAYGALGGNVSLQLMLLYTTYPLTIAGATAIYFGVALCVALLSAAAVSLLSAYLPPFSTIISFLVVLFAGMFIEVPSSGPFGLLKYFLPAQMMDYDLIFSVRLPEIFGHYFEPASVICTICFCLTPVLTFFAYRGFKNHQVR